MNRHDFQSFQVRKKKRNKERERHFPVLVFSLRHGGSGVWSIAATVSPGVDGSAGSKSA
jgi:hypothetical protein